MLTSIYYSSSITFRSVTNTLLVFVLIILLSCNKNNNQQQTNQDTPIFFKNIDELILKGKQQEANQLLDSHRNKIAYNDINNLAYFYIYKAAIEPVNYTERNNYADSALNLFLNKEIIEKYSKTYIKALINKNEVLLHYRKYEKALENYLIIKSLINKDEDPLAYVDFIGSIANLYYEQNNYAEAIKYFKEQNDFLKTLDLKKFSPNRVFYLRQGAISNTGYTYEKNGQLDSAEITYNIGINYINEELKSKRVLQNQYNASKVVYLDNLGGLMAKIGRLDTAEKILKESIAIPTKTLDLSKNTTYIKLAKVYTQLGELKKADSTFKIVEKILSVENFEGKYNTNKFLIEARSTYYAVKKDYQNAYYYLKNNNELRDSIKKYSNAKTNADLSDKFINYESQEKLKALNKNNKYKSVMLIFAGIVIVLLALIVFLIIKNYNQAKKTAQKTSASNNKLTIAMNKLEKRNKDYAKMMKIMAHDLKNPLAGMMGVANLLLEDKKFSKENQEMLKLISNTGENTIEMINQLLNSGLAVENEILVKDQIDIHNLLKQCCDLLQYRADEKNQKIIFISGGPIKIEVSKEKIWRVFNNLIVNAIKFSPIGSEIKVILEYQKKGIRIAIIDNGIGIADENKSKIFEMFTSAKRHGTSGEQPFGLGLAISKQIIESHDGKLWVVDNPEGGTIFYIELP